MHTYERPTRIADPFPSFADLRFNSALDVVAFAEINVAIGRTTWPETWHLDNEGRVACSYWGSSNDSIKGWARDPSDLCRARRRALSRPEGCTARWLIVDSRALSTDQPPDEGDARAYLVLQRKLALAGLQLLDTVVFDDNGHWWSLREMATGATAWVLPMT